MLTHAELMVAGEKEIALRDASTWPVETLYARSGPVRAKRARRQSACRLCLRQIFAPCVTAASVLACPFRVALACAACAARTAKRCLNLTARVARDYVCCLCIKCCCAGMFADAGAVRGKRQSRVSKPQVRIRSRGDLFENSARGRRGGRYIYIYICISLSLERESVFYGLFARGPLCALSSTRELSVFPKKGTLETLLWIVSLGAGRLLVRVRHFAAVEFRRGQRIIGFLIR